jgi:hypothetical protein
MYPRQALVRLNELQLEIRSRAGRLTFILFLVSGSTRRSQIECPINVVRLNGLAKGHITDGSREGRGHQPAMAVLMKPANVIDS